jgi:methylenetetrahydrofolate dehydrogenase (NADP+) / methenyltetrahydrofolate cyclohydrolase
VIDLAGKSLAASIRESVTADASALLDKGTGPAWLAIVTATDNESSAWYVRSIANAAAKCGLTADVIDVADQPNLLPTKLAQASADDNVHGIILQTPLPPGSDVQALVESIDAAKDVDGANPLSLGRLTAGLAAFAPATAEAVVRLLDAHLVELRGRHVAVVGRSTVVGKPLAQLLLARDATVTICHSRTTDLADVTRSADIVVAAAGQPGLITAHHIKPGAAVVDVGINPTPDGGLVGDVDASASRVAGALSPVPGGVGPVTTALLLRHTVDAARSLTS